MSNGKGGIKISELFYSEGRQFYKTGVVGAFLEQAHLHTFQNKY
jgi:hypothetical protein